MGCYYAYHVGPLSSKKWEKDIQALLSHMRTRREVEWLGIKELWPLDFMGYIATTFKEVTGHHLPGLKDFTGWIRAGGYYHWRVAELGQVDRCPHLKGLNKPAGPRPRPSFSTPPSVPPLGKTPRQEAPPSASGDQPREAATPSQGADLPPLEDADDATSWYSRVTAQERLDAGAAKTAAFVAGLKKASGRPVTSPPGATRSEDLLAVYAHIAPKWPPPDNIASPWVQAYYTKLLEGQHRTLASHILAMIPDYHSTCALSGPQFTSPITSPQIEERLPSLGDYTATVHQPSHFEGSTDIRVRDHYATTLRVAVWLHRLDMALEPHGKNSWTLQGSQHSMGALLRYLLTPGTVSVSYPQVLVRVLEENKNYYQKQCGQLMSWLRMNAAKRTRYLEE